MTTQTDLFGNKTVIPQPTKDLVERVLREFPQARNDDMFLYAKIWEFQGIEMNFDQFKKSAMKPETVGRHKRFLQEHGRYTANEAVKEARAKKAEEFKEYYGND